MPNHFTLLRLVIASVLMALALTGAAFGQGYVLNNFSQCTPGSAPTSACLLASWYGSLGTGQNYAGCTSFPSTSCGIEIHNSNSSLTLQNPAASVCGTPPAATNGLIFDYSTTAGTGQTNQGLYFTMPGYQGAGGTFQSTATMYAGWFCTDIPAATVIGGTIDNFVVIGSGSQLANLVFNGSATAFLGLEGCTPGAHSSCPSMPYTIGTWVYMVGQYVQNAACNDQTNFTDCVRLAEYSANGSLIAQQAEPAGGNNLPAYFIVGNINSETIPTGHHIQMMDLKMGYIGMSPSQFATTFGETPALPWDGLVTPGRAVDWTQAGIPGSNSGTLPDSSWTQCGATIAAYTGNASTITTALAGCSANQYVLLGSGTFTLDGQIKFPATTGAKKLVLRGAGANSTFLVHSGTSATACAQSSAFICVESSDGTFTTGPPSTIYNWTAGYGQGSNLATFSSVTSISTSTPTLLFMDGCDTGYSGTNCGTGSAVDNSQLYICGDKYASTPTGCSADGPDGGGSRPERDQLEIHTATNIAGNIVTVSPVLLAPNWAALSNPEVWLVQPMTTVGVENLSIDGNASGAPTQGIEFFNIYNGWISGVRFTNWTRDSVNLFQTSNSIVQNNYLYNCRGSAPSCYGIRQSASANNLLVNNIIQHVLSPIFDDGASTGHVIAYNFIVNDQDPSNDLSPAITEHAGNYLDLFEGNITNQVTSDDIHGTGSLITRFRNFLTGWESQPSSPISSFTQSLADYAYARYENNIANVMGTPGYHTQYQTNAVTSIYFTGAGNGGVSPAVPSDSLTKSTELNFASYDSVSAAKRFCGNSLDTGWGTTCSSTSEASFAASTFPSFVPTVGDTLAGQGGLPSSFFYSSAPSWWGSLPFPGIGPDISSGTLVQCGGTLNTSGKYNGMPALSTAECAGSGAGTGWASLVNPNPAMQCALSVMGMPPDGSGSALSFNASACYQTGAAPAGPTFGTSIGIGKNVGVN